MKKKKLAAKKKNVKKKRVIKKYGFSRLLNFSSKTQPHLIIIFLYNFLIFYIYKIIKFNYFKVWVYRGRMRKKKRIFLKSFYSRKHTTLKYRLIRRVYFKIFQFLEIILTFDLLWAFKIKYHFNYSNVLDKYNVVFSVNKFKEKKLFYFNSFFKKQNFSYNWSNFRKVYDFTRNFLYRHTFTSFMLANFNKNFISLFFITVKNPWIVKFNFKVRGFKSLVRETSLSKTYKSSFKLARKFMYKKVKSAFFILKIKHIRWLQTHINFILDVRANFYFPRFIFFEHKYLKKLFFFKTIFNEYWLAKYLFYSKNNRRWLKFFKLFKPKHYFSKLNGFNVKKLQRLNSTQFNWLVKSQKSSVLKHYYLIKYSKLAFFFFFYLKLFWKQIFNVDLSYLYRRFKFKKKTQKLIKSIYSRHRIVENQLNPSFFLLEAIEILFITMRTKNSYFFHKWMCEKIGKIYYKKHFKTLNFINVILNKYFNFFKHYYQVKGVQYVVKGKINMKGSVRKRKVIYQVGKVSYSDLSIRNSSNFGIARTDTGALGIFFLISF